MTLKTGVSLTEAVLLISFCSCRIEQVCNISLTRNGLQKELDICASVSANLFCRSFCCFYFINIEFCLLIMAGGNLTITTYYEETRGKTLLNTLALIHN